jgi:hypothetical protein
MTTKKPLEEMTESELLAHIRAIKRRFSKKLQSFSSVEEQVAWVNAEALRRAAECGIKLNYAETSIAQ